MEASGPVHQLAHDVMSDGVRRVFDDPGPFVSVYLDVTAAQERAHDRAVLHWKNLRKQLANDGAPEEILHHVDGAVDSAVSEGDTLAVIATERGLLHSSFQPDPPTRDLGRFGPLPSIGPLLEWRQSSPSHVVVLADRVGADVFAFVRDGRDLERHVDGDTDPIRRVGPGGWSQRRYQQRAENTWEANAASVATTVAKLADRLNPRVIIAGGDVRAVQFLEQELPDRLRDLLRVVDASRAIDGSGDEIAEEAVRMVATAVAEDTVETLRKFREELGQDDRAATGVGRTIDALAQARVETLLIHDDPDDVRTAWFGPEASHVATEEATLRALGVAHPVEARLVDVLIRAAAGTGAGVWMIPTAGGPRDGVGALLRW